MIKLNEHLKYQMNHMHGSLFDFIYKCHELLEHNKIKNDFYKEACDTKKVLYYGKEQTMLLEQIAEDIIEVIEDQDEDLAHHLAMCLLRIQGYKVKVKPFRNKGQSFHTW